MSKKRKQFYVNLSHNLSAIDICKVYMEKLLGNYQVTFDFLEYLEVL